MPTRLALFTGAVGLVMSLFAGAASAAPALTSSPQKLEFGTVIGNGLVSRDLVITNTSQFVLGPGTYQLTGDVNLPVPEVGSGFLINLGLSTCFRSGDTVSGTTRQLGPGRSCTFEVAFAPLDLPSGKYTAKLGTTFGKGKVSIATSAQRFRIG
jgi:hypothetical protein